MPRFSPLAKPILFLLISVILAVTFSAVIYADQVVEDKNNQTTVLVQMSDPQFYFQTRTHSITKEESEKRAQAAIQSVNQLRPEAVVVTGDLIQTPGSKEQTATFWRIFKQLDPSIPLYCVPGNHDVHASAESLASYRKKFGKDYYAFSIGPDRFLVLNSVLLGAKADETEEAAQHWKWIEAELKRAKADKVRHTVVFLHHPLFIKKSDEKDAYFNLPTASRERLFRLFHQYEVDAVFAGHHHKNGLNQHQGIDYIITSSVCVPLDEKPAGFRIIKLKPDGITHQYVPTPEPAIE